MPEPEKASSFPTMEELKPGTRVEITCPADLKPYEISRSHDPNKPDKYPVIKKGQILQGTMFPPGGIYNTPWVNIDIKDLEVSSLDLIVSDRIIKEWNFSIIGYESVEQRFEFNSHTCGQFQNCREDLEGCEYVELHGYTKPDRDTYYSVTLWLNDNGALQYILGFDEGCDEKFKDVVREYLERTKPFDAENIKTILKMETKDEDLSGSTISDAIELLEDVFPPNSIKSFRASEDIIHIRERLLGLGKTRIGINREKHTSVKSEAKLTKTEIENLLAEIIDLDRKYSSPSRYI